MIQNLSFANHLSGQRKIDLVVFHCHLAEWNMKNTCVGWRNSCEQFEDIGMALSSMLGGAARAVQAVQPATCLRCSRLRETHEGSHVSRLCQVNKSILSYQPGHYGQKRSRKVYRHQVRGKASFSFSEMQSVWIRKILATRFLATQIGDRLFSGGKKQGSAQIGWICSEIQAHVWHPKRNPGSIDDKNAFKESSPGSFAIKVCISRLANHMN